jgi:hypothetical protein
MTEEVFEEFFQEKLEAPPDEFKVAAAYGIPVEHLSHELLLWGAHVMQIPDPGEDHYIVRFQRRVFVPHPRPVQFSPVRFSSDGDYRTVAQNLRRRMKPIMNDLVYDFHVLVDKFNSPVFVYEYIDHTFTISDRSLAENLAKAITEPEGWREHY